MTLAIEIRPVRPDEWLAVGTLTVEAYYSLPGFEDPTGYASELLDVEGRVRDAEVFVATRDDDILGCITFVSDNASPMAEWDVEGSAGIRMLAVAPSAHGQGVGRQLTDYCVARARKEGRSVLLLHSTPFMEIAQGLYKRMGFERYPEIDFFVEEIKLMGFRLEL
jgi:ribosomal protein S18 acetylase RimI-like enzyme